MIQTNDAVAALRFIEHAQRLGLAPTAREGYRCGTWELETRNGTMGCALWGLLRCWDGGDWNRISMIEVQEFHDERESFYAAQMAEAGA